MIVDNETPRGSLENHLNRFAQHFGFKDYSGLPIQIYPNRDFLFDRKVELDKLKIEIKKFNPVYIRFDSLVSMLPLGRNNISENSNYLGGVIGKDLNEILSVTPDAVTDLVVHTKKSANELSIQDLRVIDVSAIVRGHGSIVGQGCDTAVIFKKISEHPARFCIVTRSRRTAIPMDSKLTYLELKETSFGHGSAHLEEIDSQSLPPSREAKEVFQALINGTFNGHSYDEVTGRELVSSLALFRKSQIIKGLDELKDHNIVENGIGTQSFKIRSNFQTVCNTEYLALLA